jgi:hypothetical protein
MSSRGPSVVSIGGPGSRSPLIIVALLVGGLVVAVVKPWGDPTPRSGAPSSMADLAAVTPTVANSPSPGPSAANAQCQVESGWRLSAIQVNDGRPIKTWYSVAPALASGPTDSTIPTIRIYAESLLRLGYCVRPVAAPSVVADHVSAWRVSPGRPAVTIQLVKAIDPGLDELELGVLFDPPRGLTGVTPRDWAGGRYVFAVDTGSLPGDRLWFAADVSAVSARLAGPSAPASTSP